MTSQFFSDKRNNDFFLLKNICIGFNHKINTVYIKNKYTKIENAKIKITLSYVKCNKYKMTISSYLSLNLEI